jgi:hypothetical protein
VLQERCRLVVVLGPGGISKTSLVARLAQDAAPSFERVYWRSLRDASPVAEWLTAAIGFLSGQQVVPPASESEQIGALLRLLALSADGTIVASGGQMGWWECGRPAPGACCSLRRTIPVESGE